MPHIEHVADQFASEGFIALAPDLYHGQTAKAPDQASKLMMSLRVDEAERDLAAAIDYLAALSDVAGPKVSYPDAAHAFFNDERPEVYDAATAKDAWAKTLAFFRRELRA